MSEEIIYQSIMKAEEAEKKAPEVYGVPSGIEGLDELFFTVEVVDGKPQKRPLGGIPSYSVMNITGISDTGKSLMAEQFAVKQASRGEKVLFVTVETPANYVVNSLRARAIAMGFNWDELKDNILLLDAASYHRLRENIPNLLATLAHVYKTYKVKFTVIDSITGLFEQKEMTARTIVRQVYNFLKKWYQTAILVSQKRSGHEELTAEAAGGYAVGHIVDGTIVLAKQIITTSFQSKLYKKPIGELVRLFRIDGCRVSGHDTRTYLMEITETGLVKILKPLSELVKNL